MQKIPETMRALLVREHGWPSAMRVERVACPTPGKGQVLVRVGAAGLNFADTLVIAGTYQERQEPPFVPGAEICGEIVECGSDAEGWRVGERVMGQVDSGAYAEYAVADARRIARVPSGMTEEVGAGFYIPYGTALCALRERGRLEASQTLLVLGAAGAVGQAAVQVGRALGARVIGTSRHESRREAVMNAGADGFVATAGLTGDALRDRLMEASGGADVVFDTVGGTSALAALRCLRFEGRLVVIGFTAGDAPVFRANHVLVKNIDVVGCYWGPYQTRRPEETRRAFETLADWHARQLIRPAVSDSVALADVPRALEALTRGEYAGKVVARIQESSGGMQ